MGFATQILLVVSYAILGLAVMVLPPRLFGFSETTAGMLGMFVFFGAWQLQNWLMTLQGEENAKNRIDRMEDNVRILRGDLERTRRDIDSKSRNTEEKSDKLVSELKVLHTLLGQVMAKEIEFQKSGKATGAPLGAPTFPGKAAVKTDADAPVPDRKAEVAGGAAAPEPVEEKLTDAEIEELELTPEEIALASVDSEESENGDDDGQASDAGAGEAAAAGVPAPVRKGKVRKKAPIRLIKREDQLLSVIRSSLSENRVDLYLQAIVALPGRRTVNYECFSRVRDEDGRIILPRQYMKVAETKGLIGTIDNLLLFRLIQLVRRLGRRKPDIRFFCNMSRYSMTDKEFFPQFIDFMTANEEFKNRLVFEISQDDYLVLDEEVKERLLTLGRKGFGFSMDMVHQFDMDFARLGKQHFQFIKSDLRDILATHPADGDVEVFKSMIRRNGMQLIASRIESEEMVLQALDAQVEFAQGYLFGEPTAATDLNSEL